MKWRKDWSKEIDTSRLFTGTAMSPIIAGGLLIVHVGDDDAGAFRALDPTTGAEKWALPGHGPGYASPIVANFGGTRQIVTMTDKAVVGVEIASGKELWKIPFPDEWNENIVTPVVAGDILVVSGTRKGTLGFKVAKAGASLTATQVWHNTDVPMYMSSPVVDGTLVYGFSNRRKGQLFCLTATTGDVKWTTEGRAGTNAAIQSAGGLPPSTARGHAGEMLYLERSVAKQLDPGLVLPGARAIVSCAFVYSTDRPYSMSQPRDHAAIARYAWGDDYHAVLERRLEAFESWMREQAGGECLSRRYVEQGRCPRKRLPRARGSAGSARTRASSTSSSARGCFSARSSRTRRSTPMRPCSIGAARERSGRGNETSLTDR